MKLRLKQSAGSNAIFALIIVLFFVGAELCARIYLQEVLGKSPLPKYQFDSYRVFSQTPGFKEGKDGKNWILINSQGFRRAADVQKIKPAGTFRVFLLGASVANGISSARPYPVRHLYPHETIDANLERLIQDKYPTLTIEVINAAVPGYQVFQHTFYILSELLDYDPDLVIFFDGYNDHFVTNPDYDQYKDYHYQFWRDKLRGPSFIGLFEYFTLWMSRYSVLARGYFAFQFQNQSFQNKNDHSMVKIWKTSEEVIANHREAARKLFLRSVDTNLLLLKEFGIDAIVCFQPILALRNKELLSTEEEKWMNDWLKGTDASSGLFYPVIIEELQSVATKHNAALIDIAPFFNSPAQKGRRLFIDYAHLSPEGSEAAAQALLPFVEQSLTKRLSKSQALGGELT